MKAMEKRINILPAPTWNQLSVNAAAEELSLPDLTQYRRQATEEGAVSQAFPAGSLDGLPKPCMTGSILSESAKAFTGSALSGRTEAFTESALSRSAESFMVSVLPENTETMSPEEAEHLFQEMPESGMGAYYDEKLKAQANAGLFIRVKPSEKEGPDPVETESQGTVETESQSATKTDSQSAAEANSQSTAKSAGLSSGSCSSMLRTDILLTQKADCALTHHRILLEEGATFTLVQTIRSEHPAVLMDTTAESTVGSAAESVTGSAVKAAAASINAEASAANVKTPPTDPPASGRSVPPLAADLTEIYAKKGAKLQLFQIQAAGSTARSYQAVAIRAEEGAEVEVIRATLGGEAALCGSKALLLGRGSHYQLHAVYFAAGTQRFDFNDIADHRGKDTQSDLCTAGVLAGKSDKILRGTIDFKAGAARAVGHESETVLLLGNEVRNRTVPLILCGEEDVEGQHAASSGKPDAAKLYYLTSRGLTKAQAERLVIEGRFAPVLDRIPEEGLRKLLTDEIDRRLTQYEAEHI